MLGRSWVMELAAAKARDQLDRLMAAAEELEGIAACGAAKVEGGGGITLDELRRKHGL
jgi:hypothetical protein